MLPAIRARIALARRRRPEPDVAREVLNRIRHAAGSLRADDDVDIAARCGARRATRRSAASG